jgi:transposase-like protein
MGERTNGKQNGVALIDPSTLPTVTTEDGRSTKLSPARRAVILESLKKGRSIQATASLAGVNKSTIYRWLKRARKGDEAFIEFLEQIEYAQAQFEAEAVDAIRKKGKEGAWQAYAWMLERKHPDRWGRHNVHRHEGHEGGPIEFSLNLSVGREPIQRIVEIDDGNGDSDEHID